MTDKGLPGVLMDVTPLEPRPQAMNTQRSQADLPTEAHGVPPFREVYEEHVSMVWRTLQRVGVPSAALDDVAQEVFLSVHRALPTWEGRGSMRSWIYSVARDAPACPPTQRCLGIVAGNGVRVDFGVCAP